MRIIDADELIKMIWATYCKGCNGCNKNEELSNCRVKQIIGDIIYAPTIDLWRYPSKGELPNEDVTCLVCTTSGDSIIAMIDSADKCWCTGEFFSDILRDDCIVCWQYITLPNNKA